MSLLESDLPGAASNYRKAAAIDPCSVPAVVMAQYLDPSAEIQLPADCPAVSVPPAPPQPSAAPQSASAPPQSAVPAAPAPTLAQPLHAPPQATPASPQPPVSPRPAAPSSNADQMKLAARALQYAAASLPLLAGAAEAIGIVEIGSWAAVLTIGAMVIDDLAKSP